MNIPEYVVPVERGKIRNKEFAQQIKDFGGLRWGTITPTDIDGCLDFGNKVFVFIELKFKDHVLPYGQRLALERVVDAIGKDKIAVLVLARHDVPASESIDVAQCRVIQHYYKQKWVLEKSEISVREFIDSFLSLSMPEAK